MHYDVVIVGGGLGGAAFAIGMAKAGARVLVVERETRFQDRVRGEFMEPWGVAEACRLGIYEKIHDAGHEIRWMDMRIGEMALPRRDCIETTPHHQPNFAIYHPTMQEALLAEAAEAGAEVRRGAKVRDVKSGTPPTIAVESNGRVEELRPRLVVGADGRSSMVRKWCGFETIREPDRYYIAGLVLEEMPAPEDLAVAIYNPMLGQVGYLFPQGDGRVRAYTVYPSDADFRLQGDSAVARFVSEAIRTGVPPEYYQGARADGPLASFITADHWVENPYHEGVVLIGDAAAASDPIWGLGLSLTCRDVRVLIDLLRRDDEWDRGCREYAAAHDHHFGILHSVDNCLRQVLIDTGPDADARRARVLPLMAQDPSRFPDHGFVGPDKPFSELDRRRALGEE